MCYNYSVIVGLFWVNVAFYIKYPVFVSFFSLFFINREVKIVKKALGIIKNVLVYLVVAFAVLMMIFTIMSVTTVDRHDRGVFGYKAYIVKTDSMSKTDFDAGDLVFVKNVKDPTKLEEGDIITFLSQDGDSFGETVTHKIRRKTTDAKGNPGFITYGTTTDTDDKTVVTYPFILGEYVTHIDNLGHFFNFMKTTTGYFVCIFIPFMLLILYQGYKCVVLFRRYRAEQMAEMQNEREKLAAEREENIRVLAELEALKAQLSKNGNLTDGNAAGGESAGNADNDGSNSEQA